jgi:outer membrane protein TolC
MRQMFSPRDPAWLRRWSKPGGCIPRLRRWRPARPRLRAAQDIAAGLTPEPGSVSFGSIGDRLNRNQGKQEYEVELATSLWLPGQRAAREAEASSRIDEASGRRAALRLELAGELRDAWWALAAARNAKELAVRRLDTARALEADVRRRYTVGELSRIDANLAQGEVHAAGAELIESEATLLQAEQALRTLTGAVAPEDMAERSADHAANFGRHLGCVRNPSSADGCRRCRAQRPCQGNGGRRIAACRAGTGAARSARARR